MKPTVYEIEIFYPNSRTDVWRSFESSTPFLSFHKGDLVDPSSWSGSRSPLRLLRVTQVNHVLSETDEQTEQKVEVFTEEVMAFEAPSEEENE
ncbi:MAG TPA: hypothetical protein VE288_13650 [Rubrobacteraceae bacterium]|jgi:hypothetical protein|nr:hypothetical protein [Rubrobacteraceae bacterium]